MMFLFEIQRSLKNDKKEDNEYIKCEGFECLKNNVIEKYTFYIKKDIYIFPYITYITDEKFIKKSKKSIRVDYVYSFKLKDINEEFEYNDSTISVENYIINNEFKGNL